MVRPAEREQIERMGLIPPSPFTGGAPTAYLANMAAVGYGKEANYGTGVPSTAWLPLTAVNITRDPRVIYPKLMRGTRAAQPVAVNGIRRLNGTIGAPLMPDAGMGLFVGGMGSEAYTTGTVPGTPVTGTLAAATAVGATTITTTATFVANQFVQVDTAANKIAEVRKITNVSGTGTLTLTLDQPLRYAHAGAGALSQVIAPYSHYPVTGNALASFSIEKNLAGNNMDIQYTGSILSKWDLRLATNAEAGITYTVDSQQDTVLASAGTVSEPSDQPYGPGNIAVSIGGYNDLTASSIDLTLDNKPNIEDAFTGNDYPTGIYPGERIVSGKCTVFLQALNGGLGTNGYYALLEPAVGVVQRFAFVVTLTQGTASLALTVSAAALTRAPQNTPYGQIIKQDLEFTATVGGGNNDDFEAVIINNNYLNY